MKNIFCILIAISIIPSCLIKEQIDISFEGVSDFDLTQTLNKAKKEDKTVLLYFSGIACVNCRTIEEVILSHSETKRAILEDYIFVTLMVDDRAMAEKKYWKQSMFSNDTLKRIGAINSQLQIELTQSGSQPKFAIVSNNKNVLSTMGYPTDRNEFLKFLE